MKEQKFLRLHYDTRNFQDSVDLLRLTMQLTFESSFLSKQQFFEEIQIFIYVGLLVRDCF